MLEYLGIKLGNDAAFEAAVHGDGTMPVLPEGGDCEIITKDHGTESGRALACITWTVQVEDGKRCRVQATVTLRNLMMAFAALRGRYGDDGRAGQ